MKVFARQGGIKLEDKICELMECKGGNMLADMDAIV
jgi:hypothetical protein